ncbi:NmrA family NAD(P)-binding protein [Hymenobacter terrenus]|uniref:NmrA family NAD(P)-binding protein n=1 Tax=Hymenobacter terrenus TaxID=1629124 RepID=UPI0012E093C1|nr:NmrA family NAD(P)-binding protein [Hymenobacter terrenus]
MRHIVFMSVQGAENNHFIPHHKTEQLLMASGVPYTLLRPAYFMQNLTTTLRTDVVERHRIFLPAGKARFALIDVRDIGDVAAAVFTDESGRHHGQAYALTAQYRLNFRQMADQLTAGLGRPITYVSPSLWRFYRTKRREGLAHGFVLIMLLLHYLPRFSAEPPVTDAVARITGRPPREFAQFVADNRAHLLGE